MTDFKQNIKPEYHEAYDAFVADLDKLSSDEVWTKHYNDGNLQDHTKVPFMLLTSSDEVDYCIDNGYLNTTILTDEFLALSVDDQVPFVESYASFHSQEM